MHGRPGFTFSWLDYFLVTTFLMPVYVAWAILDMVSNSGHANYWKFLIHAQYLLEQIHIFLNNIQLISGFRYS